MLSVRISLQTWYRQVESKRVGRVEKIGHINIIQRKAWLAVLMSEKVDFNKKKISKDRKGQYIMIKGTLYQKDTAILFYFYFLRHSNFKYVCTKQSYKTCEAKTEKPEKRRKFTIKVGEFDILLSITDRIPRQRTQ